MILRSLVPVSLSLSLIVGANLFVKPAVEHRRISTDEEQELVFFPSGKLLKQISCGFESVVADLLWLRTIQYYGKHRQSDLVFDKAFHVFRVLTDLDPGFIEAFRFGALVLIEDANQKKAGFELLRKGIRRNPREGSLCFDLAFHYYMNEDFDKAAVYFEKVARLPGGNEKAARFAAYALNRRGKLDVAEEMWREILETTNNEKTKATADFALRGIAVQRDTTVLAEQARNFRSRAGRYPLSLSELVQARLIPKVPPEPYETYYVIQPRTGEVRSWFLLARELKRDCTVLEKIVARYREDRGVYAADLEELHREAYLTKIPAPFGVTYRIDQATGRVEATVGQAVVGESGS